MHSARPESQTSLCFGTRDKSKRVPQLGLTVEVRSAARHEELDGLNLGQVSVLVLLLGVAVSPVVK